MQRVVFKQWPPNYTLVLKDRQSRFIQLTESFKLRIGAFEYYSTRPREFINDWCSTYDPRNVTSDDLPALLPFILFRRQDELVDFLYSCFREQENGLVEKTRDMGATWVCCCLSVWFWIFVAGSAVGWGSRKESLIDTLGDPDSIFEKMRMIIDNIPRFFWPRGFDPKKNCSYMKIINPENGATITGEAGVNIGRGGRKSIYFKDESAHYERPELIESALGDNTNVQIDISSVHGSANVFCRRREAGIVWGPDVEFDPGDTRVFVLDWRDHPSKDQAWYDKRRAKAEREGLLHIFAQEIDRDYTSSIEGIVIPSDWVKTAIDAHLKLMMDDDGISVAALDVADGGRDKHALSIRKGIVLNTVKDWSHEDAGKATRRAVATCDQNKVNTLYYDSIGVGSTVKAETNRLIEEKRTKLTIMKWDSRSTPLFPNKHILINIDGTPDKESPKNKDFYANLKAQGWWQLRARFERTYKAITENMKYPHDTLISLSSKLPCLHDIVKELSQPTVSYDGKGRLLIDKTPKGSSSPNKGDSIMMNYWPIPPTANKIKVFNMVSIEGASTWNQ